jgi:predicted transcriptional regulator
MSLPPMISEIPRSHKGSSNSVTINGVESGVGHFLDALGDTGCRTILDIVSTDALTTSEVSEACDMPLSTTYRKLNILTDAGLLKERTRFNQSGNHASEYVRSVDEIVISLSD